MAGSYHIISKYDFIDLSVRGSAWSRMRMPTPASTSDQQESESSAANLERALLRHDWRSAKIDRWIQVAIILLILSLVIPWWQVTRNNAGVIYFANRFGDENFWFLPILSAVSLSELGTRLATHFLTLAIFLTCSIVLLACARRVQRNRPSDSALLLWTSISFCGVGLLLFSILFPNIENVGTILWPYGSFEWNFSDYRVRYSWIVLPGFFLALFSFALQLALGIKMTISSQTRGNVLKNDAHRRPLRVSSPLQRASAASIAWALISAGLWIGISYGPTYSAIAISNDWDFEFKSFKPGEVVTVADRVREVSIVHSTKGVFTRILLGEPSIVIIEVWLRGDQRTSYPKGSWATIPLHVRTYYYNDIPYVWSDEAIAPYSILLAIAGVLTAVSIVAGFPLFVDERDASGSSLVVDLNDGLPLDAFQVTINQGTVPYVGESAFLTMEPLEGNLDKMNPLREGASDNGTFSFSDENANGLLDWGDRFSLNLPATEDEYHIDSYVLSIFGPMVGIGYILMQKESPLFFHLLQTQEYSHPFYFLGMPPDHVSNGNCTSQVRIERRWGRDEYTSNSSLRLHVPGIGMPLLASANATHLNIGHGVSVHYNDTNKIGILDEGDGWLFENLTDSTFYELDILSEDMIESGSITWVCGLGYNIAHRPRVALSSPVPDPFDTTLYRIAVDSVSWYVTGSNASYYVLLRKNGTTLLPEHDMWPYLRLNQLPSDPSNDGVGTVLSFNDTDGNGYFGAGDEFMVNNTASGSRYELVLFFPGYREPLAVVTWDT